MRNGRSTTLHILLVLVAGFSIRLNAQFVYTLGSTHGATKILGFTITSTGALVPVPGSPFTAGSDPSEIVADPKGKYVYVINQPTLKDGGNISAFRVSSTGELSAVPGSPFGRNYYGNLLVDPNGKFLFAVVISVTLDPLQPPSPDLIAAFRIGSSGSLVEVPGSPFIAGINSGPLVTDRSGRFLYVGVDDEEPFWAPEPPYIAGYKIEWNGALTPLPGSPFATSAANYAPIALVQDPRGKYIYEFNELAYVPNTGSVAVYEIADDGALALVPNSAALLDPPTTTIVSATAAPKAGLVFTALYSSLTNGTGTIASSKIGAEGSLTPIVVPAFTSDIAFRLAAEPFGKFLYATHFVSTGLWEYQIAADGSLTPVPGSPVVLNSPFGTIAIVPAGVHRVSR